MTGENPERRSRISFLYEGHDLFSDKLKELIATAARRLGFSMLARRQDFVAALAQSFEIAMLPEQSTHRHESKRALILRQCFACRGKPQFVQLLVQIGGDRG